MVVMILLSLALLGSVGESTIGSAVRAARRLNAEHFDNVIDAVLPLEPVGGRDETLYDHLEHDEVVFLDKACARNSSYADHLRRELLLEQRCLHENGNLPGIVEGADCYHFYLQWNSSEAIDCTNGVTIDFEAFCISSIEFEPVMSAVDGGECRADPIPNEAGTWFLDDIEGDSNDGVYSSPFFGSEQNLIVYVLDTFTLLSHEHFAHIPDENKEYLGDLNVADGEDHGTHVAGLIVGNKYGVIRDPTVKLRACNCLPGGHGSASLYESCLIAAKEDLQREQQSNPKARGVINMSLGGLGCSTYLSAMILQLEALGAITVVSAGNHNADSCLYSPACLTEVVTVGAYDSSHQRAFFSNYGDCVDAWGPGVGIMSSVLTDGQYAQMQGTSQAAPIVAAMVGQLLNLKGERTLDEIKDIVADDDHSYPISDCQSAECSAFSVQCDEWPAASSGTGSPTVTRRPTENPTAGTMAPSVSPTEPMPHYECGDQHRWCCVDATLSSYNDEMGAWFLDDIEGDSITLKWNTSDLVGDGQYSSPYFSSDDDEKLIVYVVDTYVLLSHEHFGHIPNRNKQYLGDHNVPSPQSLDCDHDHGTHVAGSIVGNKYGVIRDPTVTVKACTACPGGGNGHRNITCPDAMIEHCLIAIRDDLEDESMRNAKVRAVVSMAFSHLGCNRDYVATIGEVIAAGAIVVGAAGDFQKDACGYSPGCSSQVITVGGYEPWAHERVFDSNYGDCVDAWGPGTFIKSSYDVDGQYRTRGGTAMATAIMTGMVGQLLRVKPELTLQEIKDIIVDDDYSFPITDCKSTHCSAFSIACDSFAVIASGTEQPTSFPTPPTPPPTEPTHIECGQTLTGSVGMWDSPVQVVLLDFENHKVRDVTFTDCDSSFDTQLYLANSNGVDIQQQSTNRCGGDDCYDPEFCSTSQRETFTMSDLEVGSYTLRLKPYGSGGDWSLSVLCHGPRSSGKAAPYDHSHDHSVNRPPAVRVAGGSFDAVDTASWTVRLTGKDAVIWVLVAANLVTIMAAYCMCSRPRRHGKGQYVKVVAMEGDTDLEAVALKQ